MDKTTDKLPHRIELQINRESDDYRDTCPNVAPHIAYNAGATAWATWKVKHDEWKAMYSVLDGRHKELQAQAQRIADALQIISDLKSFTDKEGFVKQVADNALQQWKNGKGKEVLYVCPCCKGDGKETCINPDHRFIKAIPGDISRLGCPVCGHDPKHKVKNGGACTICNGTGVVNIELFKGFCEETGYDDEPELITNPTK